MVLWCCPKSDCDAAARSYTESMAPITVSGENPNISPALSGIIASLIVMIALEYCWVIYWSLAAANRVPLEVNKVSGLYVQRYAPGELLKLCQSV